MRGRRTQGASVGGATWEGMERFYSVREAGALLGGIHPSTVRRWIASGHLRAVKIGRRAVIAERELRRFIREAATPR